MQQPISREDAAKLIGETFLTALSDLVGPVDGGSVVVAGVTKPNVVLASAVVLAASDTGGPIQALESVLAFASSALACVEGQTVESVVAAATHGWAVARCEGQPVGAARAFLDWAMVASNRSVPALDLEPNPETLDEGSKPILPAMSLFGCEVELQVGGDCSDDSPTTVPSSAAVIPELTPDSSRVEPLDIAPPRWPEDEPTSPSSVVTSTGPMIVGGPLGEAVSRFR